MNYERKLKTRFRINWLGQVVLQILCETVGESGALCRYWRDATIEDLSESNIHDTKQED